MQSDFDILFLGGGNFATLTVNRLLECGYRGRIGVVDRRTDFSASHRWCSWWRAEAPEPPGTTTRWHRYSFRDGGVTHTRSLQRWKYIHVDASVFYAESHVKWAGLSQVQLFAGQPVGEVHVLPDGSRAVDCGDIRLTAPLVIDSRYRTDLIPDKPFRGRPGWWQSFEGRIVEAAGGAAPWPRDAFGLMDFDLEDAERFAFGYILPLPEGETLYEYTAFDRSAQSPVAMRDRLDRYLAGEGKEAAMVLGEERGWLPMVAGVQLPADREGSWHGGLLSGAARPASGFAFYRNARRAEKVVAAVLRGEAVPAAEGLRLADILDRVFLETLVDDPGLTRLSMRRLLHSLSGDQLAGFLAEEADGWALIRTVSALPKRPFLKGAWRALRHALERQKESRRPVGQKRAGRGVVKCA